MKRVVLTKDELFICNVGEDIVRDVVFLVEIDEIEEVNDRLDAVPVTSSAKKKTSLQGRSFSLAERKCILLCTATNSYNSGRRYYLRPDSEHSYAALIRELRHLALEARKRAKGQAMFHQSQAAVKRALDSAAAQAFTAFLIVAVRSLLLAHLILFSELLSPQIPCTVSVPVGFPAARRRKVALRRCCIAGIHA